MSIVFRSPILIADTSVLLNLMASGVFEDIIRTLPMNVCVASHVIRETIHIREHDGSPLPIPLEDWQAQGLITVVELENDSEEEFFVGFALELDDGEAATGAIAKSRGWSVGIEDKKGRLVLAREIVGCELYHTSQLLFYVADKLEWSQDKLRQILDSIRLGARFTVPRHDPNRVQWLAILGEENR